MDNLTLLRTLRDTPTSPTDTALNNGRAALLERIEAELPDDNSFERLATTTHMVQAGSRRRRVRVRFAGIGALGAATLVVGLVLTNTLGFAGWRGGADAAAADVLHEAATAAITNADPIVGPGQYLKIDTVALNLASGSDDNGISTGFVVKTTNSLYIPTKTDDTWVLERSAESPYQTFGPTSEAFAAMILAQRPVFNDVVTAGTDIVAPNGSEFLTAPHGDFYGSAATTSAESLAALPRDPKQLLNHIYWVTLGAGRSPDGEALVWIADTLRTGLVPADLRAALYEAAAQIPGVTITEKQANLNGRTGVAIGRTETADNKRQDIIIDPVTGLMIGEREVLLTAGSFYPAGTAADATTVTTTVVDTAPTAPAADNDR